mgnify:CR=1 FL=1
MLSIGSVALRIISVSFVLAGFDIIAGSVCQAIAPLYSLITSVCRQLVVLLPLTLGSWASQALQGLLVLVYEFISFSALYFILCQIQRKKLKTYVLFAFATACIRLSQLLFGMAGYWLGEASGSEAEGLYWIVTNRGGVRAFHAAAVPDAAANRRPTRSA